MDSINSSPEYKDEKKSFLIKKLIKFENNNK